MRSPTTSPRSSRSRCSASGRSRGCGSSWESCMSDQVRVQAHAKINLFLRILARESSGFHQIETAFALLELADELDVRRTASGVTLDVDGPDLGPKAENLAVRGAQ